MSNEKTYKARIKHKSDITSNWQIVETTFIPLEGELIVYKDYTSEEYVDSNGQITYRTVPAIKIGNGQNYLIDLPFVTTGKMAEMIFHMDNKNIHVTETEKEFWNNKLNCELGDVTDDDLLIFNRN